jgi:hypothetical protein
MGAWNRVGIGLSYRPARLHYTAWRNRFLGSLNLTNTGSGFGIWNIGSAIIWVWEQRMYLHVISFLYSTVEMVPAALSLIIAIRLEAEPSTTTILADQRI